jgi:thioredoxin 1
MKLFTSPLLTPILAATLLTLSACSESATPPQASGDGANDVATASAVHEVEAFTPERFEALQANGELVLIDVAASWCPTCAKQSKIIDAFFAEYPGTALKVLRVDFDDQKEWVKAFKAPRQSTLILYRGTEQLWFSVAETREDVIFAALMP